MSDITPLLRERYSPLIFTEALLTEEQIGLLLEAARWAPSSYNEQPWTFLVGAKQDGDAWQRLFDLLIEWNQGWAKTAPLLLLSVAHRTFVRNDKENPHAWHDVGLAAAMLVVQAEAMGLKVHQMSGFDTERAREVLGIPDGWDPVAMIAVGEVGDPAALPVAYQESAHRERTRRPLEDMARRGTWDTPWQIRV